MQCKIIINDHTNCQLIGLSKDLLEYFKKKYEDYVPGYRFQPKVQLGVWDGKIGFFKSNGCTYNAFLPEIIPTLIKLEYKISVVDKRVTSKHNFEPISEDYFQHILHPESNTPIILRDYQVKGVNALLQNKGGILLAGTGAGKTLCTGAICLRFNEQNLKCMVIVPDKGLVAQTKEFLIILNMDIGEYSGSKKDPDHQTVISTWQTLQHNPSIISDFHMVLVDEAHGIKGPVLQEILNKSGRNIQYRYGVTATLPKDNVSLLSVHSAIGYVQYTIKSSKLIEQGHLAKLHISVFQMVENFEAKWEEYKLNMPDSKLSYARFKSSYFPDYHAEKEYVRSYNPKIAWITKLIRDKQKNGNVFCLVDSINFGKKIIKELNVENSYFISGKDKVKARQNVYDLFADNNDIVVVATVHCCGIGLNVSRINVLVLIDLGKSFIRILQGIGRGLRKAHDKDYVDVIDICSDLKYSRSHLSERIKFYKEAEYPYSKTKIDYDK